jgi:hypothetical protein
MLKKVLCGTMAVGLATILSLPELAGAWPQKSSPTSVQHNQLELAAKKKSKKKSKNTKKAPRQTRFEPQPLHQVQQHLA